MEKSLGFLRNFPWQIRPNFETIISRLLNGCSEGEVRWAMFGGQPNASQIPSLPNGFLIFLSIKGLFVWPTKNEWR